jgi:fructose-bisphosphate aldolase class II
MLMGLPDLTGEPGRARFAYNITSVEGFRALVNWAENHRRPMILQCSERYLLDLGEAFFHRLVVPTLAQSDVGFVLHLDHAGSLTAVLRGLRVGFSSVMFDGSNLPLAANIEASALAHRVCEAAGVFSFEAEIGHVGGAEDGDDEESQYFTRVDEAIQFVDGVRPDYLAVSIGNAHGRYRKRPEIQWTLLSQLASGVDCPLVLHGGTGIAANDLRRAATMGIRKINIGTELKTAWSAGLSAAIAGGEHEPDRIRKQAEAQVLAAVERLEAIWADA